ncbi:hypothetical protein M2146_002564 [Lachnospiraceae bacterium PF1-22]
MKETKKFISKEISKEELLNAIEKGILTFEASSKDGRIVAMIGQYWFYFDPENDRTSLENYLKAYSKNKIVERVYEAVREFSDKDLDYCRCFIREMLDSSITAPKNKRDIAIDVEADKEENTYTCETCNVINRIVGDYGQTEFCPKCGQKVRIQSMSNYEKYQLEWLIEHEHSIEELIANLDAYAARRKEVLPDNEENIAEIFKNWTDECGFKGQLWRPRSRFRDSEYHKGQTKLL